MQAIALLIGMALLFDGVQAELSILHGVPFIGNLAGTIATFFIDIWAFLSIWFGFKLADPNISFMRPKRAITLLGGGIIELIPVVNALPAWTLSVVILIVISRGEEALAETLEKAGGAAAIVGKVAAVAGKVAPNPAIQQSLKRASETAQKVSSSAKGAASTLRAREAGAQGNTTRTTGTRGVDKETAGATGARTQALSRGADTQNQVSRDDTPASTDTAEQKTSQEKNNPAATDIGAPPVFRQPLAPTSTPNEPTQKGSLATEPTQQALKESADISATAPAPNPAQPGEAQTATKIPGAVPSGHTEPQTAPAPTLGQRAPTSTAPAIGGRTRGNPPTSLRKPGNSTLGEQAPAKREGGGTPTKPGAAIGQQGQPAPSLNSSTPTSDTGSGTVRSSFSSSKTVPPIQPEGESPDRGETGIGQKQTTLDLSAIMEKRRKKLKEEFARAMEEGEKLP